MSDANAPSVFESFNARALSPESVAKTFIPSEKFAQLATRCHSIVIGPRGSGKTSLLKMLQTTALEAWKHEEAEEYRSKIDYTGVFIATDISWKEQLGSIGFPHLDSLFREQLSNAGFTAHVFHSLLTAFINRLERTQPNNNAVSHRRVRLDVETETSVVKELANVWNLRPIVHSFVALKHAVKRRISEIWHVGMKEKNEQAASVGERFAKIPWLNQHFLQLTALSVEIFNDAIDEPNGRWALLFDELELAPDFIVRELRSSMRSIDERLLIKLSMSPFSSSVTTVRTATSGMADHDYNEITLWYAHKEDGYSFSENLLRGILAERGIALENLEAFLGTSPFESDQKSAYCPGSPQYKTFEQALSVDSSFRRYFEQAELSLENLKILAEAEKASRIRKIYPTLLLRLFFRKPEQDRQTRQKLRGRKNPVIYAGVTGIFAMSEGNPRWIIGISRALVPLYEKTRKRIPASVQMDEIEKSVHRFRSLLKTIPCSDSHAAGSSVAGIIDEIGEFFHHSVVVSDFRPQPYGTFTIDEEVSDKIAESLSVALNAGAIVYVPEHKGQSMIENMYRKRFRLTYLLSPQYQIPIRLGDNVALSKILNKTRIDEPEQPQFF